MKLLKIITKGDGMDRLTYLAAVIGPFLTIPQIIQFYTTHEVAGLNIYTRWLWIGVSVIRAFHAYKTHDKPLLFNAIVFFITEVIVVAGILIYR